MTSAVAIMGGFTRFPRSLYAHDQDRFSNYEGRLRMYGGCKESRLMNDSFPDFIEREIIERWA
jgi:hypothetical protein